MPNHSLSTSSNNEHDPYGLWNNSVCGKHGIWALTMVMDQMPRTKGEYYGEKGD